MNIPKDLQYTKTHEWVRVDDDMAVVGITDFAQAQLSDLTYVELPAKGDLLTVNEEVGVLESVKAASDLYAPLGGVVTEVNEDLIDHPERINSDPYGDGWLYKLSLSDPSELDDLMDADQYEEMAPEE